jgi:phage terminase large subunit GpA-like protein
MIATIERGTLQRLLEGLRPDSVLSVSEFAEAERVLSSTASAEHGPWRNRRTPYLVAIMDSLSVDSPTQFVTFMAGAQVGKTECGNNWIHYVIAHAPGPMLSVLPTVEMAKDNSKTRIDPLIENSRIIQERGLVQPAKARDANNTVLMKGFPGGFLCMTGANSPATLRSKPIKYLNLDEADGYPGDVGGEGDPCELAEARTRTFLNSRKILKTSTPTDELTSRIEPSYLDGTQETYRVPCPECGERQALIWSQVKWTDDDPTTARYACIGCGVLLENYQKKTMLRDGEWVAANPEAGPRHRSFHLSSLYSPAGWFAWEDCVRLFLKARAGGQDLLRVFVNTVLGETWKDKGEVPEWKGLYNRRRRYDLGTVPLAGAMLTAGCDIQGDRLEIEVVAYGEPRRSWSVDYIVLQGDPTKGEVWEDLAKLLERDFDHECGATMRIERMGLDTGYQSSDAYRFGRRFRKTVLCMKGQDNYTHLIGQAKLIDLTARGKTRKKIRSAVDLYPLGSSKGKQDLYAALRAEEPERPAGIGADVVPGSAGYPEELMGEFPPEWCEFPDFYEPHWFKMLCSEKLVRHSPRAASGRRRSAVKLQWEKLQERNEALDCRVMARAAASALRLDTMGPSDWQKRREALLSQVRDREAGVTKAPKRKPKQSKGLMDQCPDIHKSDWQL